MDSDKTTPFKESVPSELDTTQVLHVLASQDYPHMSAFPQNRSAATTQPVSVLVRWDPSWALLYASNFIVYGQQSFPSTEVENATLGAVFAYAKALVL